MIERLVRQALRDWGCPQVEGVMPRLERVVASYLSRVNDFNVSAIRSREDVWRKHILDGGALLQVAALRAGQRLLDVGSGAGFPGLVMACLWPESKVCCLESVGKKCRFIAQTAVEAGLDNLEVLQGRSEELGHTQWRESFDGVTARAVAELPVLAELCLPFVRPGGCWVAMKGPDVAGEVAAAASAVRLLGGNPLEFIDYTLPEVGDGRTLVWGAKSIETPPAYPRRSGVPAKHPLGARD